MCYHLIQASGSTNDFKVHTLYNVQQEDVFIGKLDLNTRKKLVKCYIQTIAVYGAETRTLQKLDQKYPDSFEMTCWKRVERINWTVRVKNEEVLQRVNEERNIPNTIK